MTDATKESLLTVLREYGFSVVVALAAGWVLRHDVLLPFVEERRDVVRHLSETQREIGQALTKISETQREIGQALTEQTRLLYALQPRGSAAIATGGGPDE